MTLVKMLVAATLVAGTGPATAASYVVIRKETTVDRPADAVWKRIGDYCAIGEWLKRKCEYIAGSGDVGTIRQLDGETQEPMIAKTEHSYTYGQTKGAMSTFAYNGTLAVEPLGAKRSKLVYTIIYDGALMPSDEVRKAQADRIGLRFEGALQTMKTLAEARR
jgi:hypothetical protein